MSKQRKPRLLVVDDEPTWADLERETLEKNGYEVVVAGSGAEALGIIDKQFFDLLILDQRMPGMSGSELLTECQRRFPDIGAIFLTGYSDVDLVVNALHLGALDFLKKPVDLKRLIESVRRALERSEIAREYRLSWFEADRTAGSTNIVGNSAALKEAINLAKQVAPTDATVLLLGETGTGKELFARLIHDLSLRRQGPFVPVNAAAISASLVEATLFGYKKGAFTDAKEDRKGYFEAADTGTLFFDEIGEMPIEFQPKLLRVLEGDERGEGKPSKKFMRLGETTETSVDVRVISATNRDLPAEQRSERFRPDLLNRLATFPITLPALRTRQDDIYPLTLYYLERHCRTLGKVVTRIPTESITKLQAYSWPGNVRELRDTIYRAVLLATTDTITPDLLHLPDCENPKSSAGPQPEKRFREAQIEFEKKYFADVLSRAHGNKSLAAELAGMDRTALYEHLRKIGMAEKTEGPRRRSET